MKKERLKKILDNLLAWGSMHSDSFVKCMIYASGMSPEELKELGVDTSSIK